jgi:hypothetical protein
MKTLCTLLFLSLIGTTGFAQGGDYEELMAKSRKARTTSIILVSTGPVIAVGGIGTLIYGLVENDLASSDYYYDGNGNYIEVPAKKYTTEIVVGAAATLVGIGVALSSIAFSTKADDYKREARRMKLKTSMDRIQIPGLQNGLANNSARQYKVSLVFPIGR